MKKEVGEEMGKGNGKGCSPGGKAGSQRLLSWGFYLSLAGGNLRRGLRGGFQQNIHQFSRCALSGSWSPSTDWSVAGVISHCNWSWCHPPGFAAFLHQELKNNWGLDVTSREERPREERMPWGMRSLFSQFCTCQALRVFCPGDLLYLTVNCLTIVFSYLSQFSYSTHQRIFLASHYPISLTFWKSVIAKRLIEMHNPWVRNTIWMIKFDVLIRILPILSWMAKS